jgi:hypothetical protein
LSRKKEVDAVDPLTQTETALRVDGRVERMEIAKNSKRILVELRGFDETVEDAYFDFFAAGGVRKESEINAPALELWNVEFLEARREAFDATDSLGVGSATFDEAGTRVFWTTRELERAGKFAVSPAGGARNDVLQKSGSGVAAASATTSASTET